MMTFEKVKKEEEMLVSYENVINSKQRCNSYLIRFGFVLE
jgi:hypothetical protein